MLFHVAMSVSVPLDFDKDKLDELGKREHARAAELQRQGKWLHLWRVVGQRANISVFSVETALELHEILEFLPLRPFMTVDVTALCRHPGSLKEDLR